VDGARVAVVGAGLAGLAAGVALKEAGCRVELFERSRLLGGRATSFTVDGWEVDNGQHVFLGCCTEFVDLATRLGMADRLRLQDRFDARVFAPDGRAARLRAAALPAPWHLAVGLLGYAELGWRDKTRVASALLKLTPSPRAPSPSEGEGWGGGSLAGWLTAHAQSAAAVAAFWEPFFVPALNAPLDAITVAEAAFVVRTAFMSEAGAARFGMLTVPLVRLAEAAAARLDVVRLRRPVTELLELGAFDGIVVAVPPDRAARLLGDPSLDAFVSRPIVDVHLWHDRGPLGFDFAALLRSPVQWVFEKAPGYLCCSMSDAGEAVGWPEERLVELGWAAVRERVRRLAGARLLRGAATRSPDATYAAPPRVRRPGPATPHPRVVVAGSWTDTGWPDTMESAVRSGRAAAAALLAGCLEKEVSAVG
jgi:squalene-associated FAD-dependent desaturase